MWRCSIKAASRPCPSRCTGAPRGCPSARSSPGVWATRRPCSVSPVSWRRRVPGYSAVPPCTSRPKEHTVRYEETQSPVITLATGPVDAYSQVLRALGRPVLYDYDPAFLGFYERVVEKLRSALR